MKKTMFQKRTTCIIQST